MYKKIVQNKKGSAAIMMTTLMLFSMMVVIMISSTIVNNGVKMGKDQIDSAKAYYSAEAGAERVLWEARKSGGIISDGTLDLFDCLLCFNNTDAYASAVDTCETGAPVPLTCSVGETIQEFAPNYYYDIYYDYIDPKMSLTIKGTYNNIRRSVELTW